MRPTVDVVLAKSESTPEDCGPWARTSAPRWIGPNSSSAPSSSPQNERGLSVRESADLATVAEDVLDATSLGDHRVHASLAPAVDSGDAVLLERIIANLVDNAVRYHTAAGDVRIETRTAIGDGQVIVANTGPLVRLVDTGRIFEPSRRLSERTSHEGFGLGPAIVASSASVHSRTVMAHLRDGGGPTVTVTIPSAGSLPQAPRKRRPPCRDPGVGVEVEFRRSPPLSVTPGPGRDQAIVLISGGHIHPPHTDRGSHGRWGSPPLDAGPECQKDG